MASYHLVGYLYSLGWGERRLFQSLFLSIKKSMIFDIYFVFKHTSEKQELNNTGSLENRRKLTLVTNIGQNYRGYIFCM